MRTTCLVLLGCCLALGTIGAGLADAALPHALIMGPRWLVPGVEGVLLLGLVVTTPTRHHTQSPRLRALVVGLIGLVSLTTPLIASSHDECPHRPQVIVKMPTSWPCSGRPAAAGAAATIIASPMTTSIQRTVDTSRTYRAPAAPAMSTLDNSGISARPARLRGLRC